MKKIKFILVLLMVFMFLISCLYWLKGGEFLRMLNGSIESTSKYLTANSLVPLLLCSASLISLLAYLKQKKYSILFFFVFLLIWILSGRTIGLHHTGELSVGWFYFETNKVVLWKEYSCEGNVLESTSFRKESLFMLRYENQCVNDRIFIGPFVDVKY